MLKIIISGCNGHMGKTVARLAHADGNMEIVAGFDINTAKSDDFPVYADPMEFAGSADVIIDFSNASSLDSLLSYCVAKKMALILCTTGYSPEQLDNIKSASNRIPIFKSANMSLGINLIVDLIQRAATILGDNYDVEIVERHHNRKVDAPSGTALLLADAVSEALPYEPDYIYDRQSRREKRAKNEIGISAVRGGTIVGDHEVIFAGLDEVIELKHSIYSREVFATGAIKAAKFMATITEPGIYDMKDLISKM